MAETVHGPLPFQEAIDFFRAKVRLPTRTWTDLWEGMHSRAFVVAGVVKAELLADFQEAVGRAIAEGRTLNDFRKDFDAIVARHGWSYNGGRGWRSAVIYNTNLRMAHSAGRWAQIQRVKARRPFIRYSAVLDSRTRPEHRAWHGTVLPADDPFWQSHMPPNGWNCRCTVQSYSQRDLDRLGMKQSPPPATPEETVAVNTPQGRVAVRVPKGIDPGFAYNPGEAAFGRGADLTAMRRHGPFTPLTTPGGNRPANPPDLRAVTTRTRLGRRQETEAGLRQALRDAIGGDERIFTDPTGARVSIGQGLVDHYLENDRRRDGREIFFPLLPELIERPQEIWVGFEKDEATGKVRLRRRYVTIFDLGKGTVVGLVTDLDGHRFAGFTFFRGKPSGAAGLRRGLRVYAGEE